jgi:threonine dehydratase
VIPSTPQIRWPLLCERVGADVWVKHENHSPVGAFKIRGGIIYIDELRKRQPDVRGVIAATRGNHGQSVAFAARLAGLRAVIVIPHGNNPEKNAAMRVLGAELIEHGEDFQEAYEHASRLAAAEGLHFLPSFHPALVRGVATYALELFRAVGGIDRLYVPIGMGSGVCGCIAARNALGLKTEIVGVVAASAPAFARSYAAGQPVAAVVEPTIADGMACREVDPDALQIVSEGASHIVTVDENEIRSAMRYLFADTHNVAEGAGAAALAALWKEREPMRGCSVAVIMSGGNVDTENFGRILLEK